MTEALSSQQLNAVHQLLDRVAERQRQDFGNIVSDIKSDGTLITTCDRWSDEAINAGLAAIAPGEGVLSEEGSKCVPSSQAYWVVDPLDGTTNFAAGIPYWAISVARWVDGKPAEVFLDVPSLRCCARYCLVFRESFGLSQGFYCPRERLLFPFLARFAPAASE